MTEVVLPRMWGKHTGGRTRVEVAASSVSGVVDELMTRFPGLQGWLDNGHGSLPDYTHVFVGELDARILGDGDAPLPADAQVRILAEMSGGSH